MVKALARAFRWRRVLDDGAHPTLEDLARTKGVHVTYVSRVLRLTLLAPEIVEAILDGWSCTWVIFWAGSFGVDGAKKRVLLNNPMSAT